VRGFVAAYPNEDERYGGKQRFVCHTSYLAPRKRHLPGENLQRRSAAWVCTGSGADPCTYHGAELGRRADDAIMTTQNTSSSDNILDHGACLSAINQTRRDVPFR
jgi:hypothetical protein